MNDIKPQEERLWTSAEVAAYLRYSVKNFTDRIMTLPNFPVPVRLPRPTGGKGHPRWKPEDIKNWIEQHREAA